MTWEALRREGIVVRQISFPVPPPSRQDLVDRFRRAITPRTRVIEVTHITNLTGQILPVREIVRMARERNIEVFVDGAHSFAHFPFRRDELECDYFGTSLHKWLFAPIGTGFLYVRKEKQKKIWPLMAAPTTLDGDSWAPTIPMIVAGDIAVSNGFIGISLGAPALHAAAKR